MIKLVTLFFLLLNMAHAYVPTVESLFRHGSNPDVSANGVSITFKVSKILPGERSGASFSNSSLLRDDKAEDYFKIFFTRINETVKIAQTRYNNANFSESSLVHKTYYPNFTPYTIKPGIEAAEKGIFYGLLFSLALNEGEQLLSYLKALDVPVRLNSELLNREKVEFLAQYKHYLALINKDRSARKTEVNPMRPEDPEARQRAEQIMAEPMYTDTNQVKLAKDEGNMAWVVNAGALEAVFSYKERDAQRIKFKSQAGDFEVIMKDYYLANGTHAFPKFILVRTFTGEQYQLETVNLRHYVEKEDDMVKRLRNWDQILKGKESTTPRPEFFL